MSTAIQFDPIRLPPECEELRATSGRSCARKSRQEPLIRHNPDGQRTESRFARKVDEKGWIHDLAGSVRRSGA